MNVSRRLPIFVARPPDLRPPGARVAGRAVAAPPVSIGWVQAFVIFQCACQVALLFPALGPLRVGLRSASCGASLLLLAIAGRGPRHPAATAAVVVLCIMGLSIFHPRTNTLLAALAQCAMYAAILAPLFWVPKAGVDVARFRRIALTFWVFHTLSAGVGVLQVYFPGKLEPALSTVVAAKGEGYVESLKITLPGGESVFRPMGLTDQPGGAASAGLYAMLFGLGLLLTERSLALRAGCLVSMALGLVCLYLAQVRSVLVMGGISMAAFCAILALRGEMNRLAGTATLLAAVVVASFAWAVAIGGDAVTKRLATLVEDKAGDVYYTNRGHFLEETYSTFLPQYPLGAGLGRWGMMNQYFGDNADPRSEVIWVEIQWTGWLLDGGVPLILAYVSALGLAFVIAWRVALDRDAGDLGLWAAMILAYNLAAFAVTFNYPLFIGQGGMEFWLLNACLFAAWRNARQTREDEERAATPSRPLGADDDAAGEPVAPADAEGATAR